MRTFLFLSLLAIGSTALAGDWPQWMGPSRNGVLLKAEWPEKLQGRMKQVWRVELEPSYSSPIVVGDRIFTTETRKNTHEVVKAFDRKTGKELWKTEWEGSMKVPFFARANGDWIRATPAYDDGRLYVAGMRDVLVCLDAATGKTVWQVDFVQQFSAPVPAFGFVSSPLVDGAHVYVQAGAAVVKLDKKTGAIAWRTQQDEGGMMGSAFSSPVIATLAGKRQLVVLTREKLVGVDLADGGKLWEQPVQAFRGMNILTPVIVGDAVFTAAYGGKSHLFSIEKTADGFLSTEKWRYKGQGYMSTPAVVDGHVWLLQRSQRIVGLNLATGTERWVSDKSFGKYWSQVASGGKMLALDERGILFLIQTTPEKLQILDEMKVSDQETWAHLAVSGADLVIRELNALTVWRWE